MDLDRLEEWAYRNLMKFNEDKCKIPNLAQPFVPWHAGNWLAEGYAEKRSGFLWTANWTYISCVPFSCWRLRTFWSVLAKALPVSQEKWLFPLLSTLRQHLRQALCPALNPPVQYNCQINGGSLMEGYQNCRGLEHTTCQERWRAAFLLP